MGKYLILMNITKITEYTRVPVILCYYIQDNRPLIIFDINDHSANKIQALTNTDFAEKIR